MTIKVSKTDARGKYLYINLSGFRDKAQRQIVFEKIEQLVKDSNTKVRVY